MKKNKLNNLVALASIGASLLVGGATSSQAALSLGANFIGRNNSAAVMVQTDSAGVVAQTNWNNIDSGGTFVGTSDPLLASDGSFTAIELDYSANDSWVSDGPTVTGNDKLMKGIIKFKTAGGSLTVKNLPTGATFDVYAYCEENGAGAEGEIAIGTVTNYIKLESSFPGTFTKFTGSAPGTPVAGNYALWSAVPVAADGTITLTAIQTSTVNDGIGIAGLQLVQVTGGAFPANTNTCSITADPASTKGLVGATATFSVGTAGPCSIMWKKNGTVIPGATSPVLNYTYTLADDNASFVAVAYNNVSTNNSAAANVRVYSADKGISLNFIGRGNDQLLATTDAAGVLSSLNWNNGGRDPAVADLTSLNDGAGNATLIDLHYDFPDSWNSDGGTGTPNEKMMKGIMKLNTANPDKNLVLKNLNPASTYDIYTYHAENGAGGNCDATLTIGTTSYYITMPASFNGVFTRATNTTTFEAANYVQFTGVRPAADGTVTINFLRDGSASSDGAGIAGLQIFNASGPGFPTNTVPVAITTQPSDTVGAVGGVPVSFTVGYTGPAKFQWQKNGVDIAGATGATYSFTPLLADSGTSYAVRVYNNVNSVMSTSANLIVDPAAPAQLVKGFMKVERWEGIGGNTGDQGITDLTNAIAGGPPTITYLTSQTAVDQTVPGIDNFGAMMSGWIVPTVTGDYDLFIRSDDQSQLFLNDVPVGVGKTNALPNIFTATPIAYVGATCCDPFQEPTGTRPEQTTIAPIRLVAGNMYGLVAIFKEGGGGDYVQVAWRLSTQDPLPTAATLTPISGAYCYTMSSPAGHRAVITEEPKDTTVVEDRPVTFSVKVAVQPVTDTYFVQWYSNNVAIPNANGPSYTIKITTLAQNGMTFKAKLETLVGPLETATAKLTVLPDTTAPVPTAGAIKKSDNSYLIGVSFDENVDKSTLVADNFTLVGATGTFKLVTNNLATYASAAFTTASLVPGTTYKVTVKNVSDTHGNKIPAAGVDASFTLGNYSYSDTGTQKRPGEVVPVGDNGFDVLSGGRGEWGTYDELTMAYAKRTADFDVKVQVVYAEPTSQWGRVGLIARNALDTGLGRDTTEMSAYAQTHVNPSTTLNGSGAWDINDPIQPGGSLTSNNGHEQNSRLTKGAATTGWGTGVGGVPLYPDVWLRLARKGDTIYGYRGENGKDWTAQGTVILTDQQPDMYVGVVLTAETGNIAWQTFDVWADPFDPKYDGLFVAKFRNFGEVSAAVTPTISSSVDATGKFIITYTGTLISSDKVDGTYAPVNGAVSPYTVPTAGPGNMFFKARQ